MKSKKTLFISTIVMVLVLVLSLSTATYAWFASSAEVTINDILMTTASTEGFLIGRVTGLTGDVFTIESGIDGGTTGLGSDYSYSNISGGEYWNHTTTSASLYGVSGNGITMFKASTEGLNGATPFSLIAATKNTDYYYATFIIQNTKPAAANVALLTTSAIGANANGAGSSAIASATRVCMFGARQGGVGVVKVDTSIGTTGYTYYDTYANAVAGGTDGSNGTEYAAGYQYCRIAAMTAQEAYGQVTTYLDDDTAKYTNKLAWAPYYQYAYAGGVLNSTSTDVATQQVDYVAPTNTTYYGQKSKIGTAYTQDSYASYFTRTGSYGNYTFTACTSNTQIDTDSDGDIDIDCYQVLSNTYGYVKGTTGLHDDYSDTFVATSAGTLANAISIGTSVPATGYAFVTIVIWFEGEDTECINAYAGGGITSDFVFGTGTAG